jgi:hypothetical protein
MLFNQHIIRTDFQRPVISMFPSNLTIEEMTITMDSWKVPNPSRDDWNNNHGNNSSSIA